MNQPPQPNGGASPHGPYNQQPSPQGYSQQQPQQGGYPNAPQGYPQAPAAYPQGPQSYPPLKRGPSKGLGVVKLLIGLCFATGLGGGLMVGGHNGIGVSAVLGAILGVTVWMMVSGAMNLAGKKLPLAAAAGVVVVVALIGAFAGPPVSEGYWTGEEERVWNELTVENAEWAEGYIWEIDYFGKIPERFQREEAYGAKKLAEVRADIRLGDLVGLREHMRTIAIDHKGDPHFRDAFNAASAELQRRYDEVLADLGKPGEAGAEAEFAVDEDLRTAFKTILTDLAKSPSPDIYLAFSNSSDLTEPEGHQEVYESYLEDPSVKRGFPDGNVPVIEPGTAFSPTYDGARRSSFIEVANGAFREVFDANLLALKPLGPGEARDGKIVLEVSSHIVRTPTYFNYYNTDAAGVQTSNGLLFGVGVEWTFKLFDRENQEMYARETWSLPGNNLFIKSQSTDPEWAVYSILMDSAYFNYSREVVGSFGLTPPAVKQEFAFKDYSRTGG